MSQNELLVIICTDKWFFTSVNCFCHSDHSHSIAYSPFLLLLLYLYCIYAFLANCRKGTCYYVQCWKNSVLNSFLNTEKVMLGSFKQGGRQFQAVGPAWKNPRGLGGGGWYKQITRCCRSQVWTKTKERGDRYAVLRQISGCAVV